MAEIEFKPLPPKEAIQYFRDKGYQQTFDWRDMWQEEHAYSFTVAKAMRNDILQDIRSAVDDALANGTTFEDFKKQLKPVLQSKGWWGRKMMVDPLTGEEREVQLGSPRRLETIFDTNMRTAYAAGRWEQVQRTKKTRPYLRYIAILDERTRHDHRNWHNTVKHADDPFWDEHYPPNGWNCRCSVQQLNDRDLQRYGLEVTKANPSGPDKVWVDQRNGNTVKVPQGISPGFGYNVGKARMKALVPPVLDKPLDVPFMGASSAVPLAMPRNLGKSALYADGLDDEAYVDKFLKEFHDKKESVFFDVTGTPLIISRDLFTTTTGKLKVSRAQRFRTLGLMAMTIKDPDEIWEVWEEYPKGRWTLRRKYIARWRVDGEKAPAFVLFDTGNLGWTGVTTFKPERESYIDRQRRGTLVYRRGDKNDPEK